MDDQALSTVVDRMYEAAAQPHMWREVLDELAAVANSQGAQLLYHRPAGAALHTASPGLDEVLEAFFREGWHVRNPREVRARRRGVRLNEVLCDHDIFTAEELDAEPWQHAFLDRYGLRWFASFNAMPFDEIAPVVLTIERPAALDPFSPAEVRQLGTVVPHIQRASRLAFAVGAAAGSGMLEGLQRVGRGAVLLDDLGLVVEMNAAAEKRLGDALFVRRRRLHAGQGGDDAELQGLIDSITAGGSFYGRPAPCSMALASAARRPLLVQGTPLVQSARSLFHYATGLLILHDLDGRPQPEVAVLREAFGLTPAEGLVAQALAGGRKPRQVAAELKLSHETVRVHLKTIFAKTGVGHQAELAIVLDRIAGSALGA
jgi:DNA-binding CsgD family transcriptional regulator